MDDTLDQLKVEYRPVSELKPMPRNVRTHSKRQVRAIADSVKAFGFRNPILVDETGRILAGHGRLQAAKLLGFHQVPVISNSGLSGAQKRAFVLADNKLAEQAGWDRDTLAIELGELSVLLPESGLDIALTGFDIGEIDGLLAGAGQNRPPTPADEPIPLPTGEPTTELGDTWVLGRHVLVCGDSRLFSTVDSLMEGERAGMVFTDVLRVRDIDHDQVKHDGPIAISKEMSAEDLDILRGILYGAVKVSRKGALHYLCVDWRNIADLIAACGNLYTDLMDICVWAKSGDGQDGLYRSAHELFAVFKTGAEDRAKEIKRPRRTRTNVWHYVGGSSQARQNADRALQTSVKPVALVSDAIRDATKRSDIVLDLFGGCGTTLIAAERTGRRARMIEREPRYVDAAIVRFQSLTNTAATFADSNVTFEQIGRDPNSRFIDT